MPGKDTAVLDARLTQGLFHRLMSPTQTAENARQQVASGEIWGRAPRSGVWPQVQAYRGPLRPGEYGIEFWTDTSPDAGGHPFDVRWSGGGSRPDVRTEGEFAKIPCVVVRIVLPSE